jgi:hypothetical protein
MKRAIASVKQLINYHENRRNEMIEFFNSDKYRKVISEPVDENIKKVIEHTDRIYNELVDELKLAIEVLEKTECHEGGQNDNP